MSTDEMKGIRGFIQKNTHSSTPVITSRETKDLQGINAFILRNTNSSATLTPAVIINFKEWGSLNKLDIYRVSGSERNVRALRKRLLDEPSPPYWTKSEQHLLCTNKFMETIIPSHLWKNFYKAVQNPLEENLKIDLVKAIEVMPHKNRTTLSLLVLQFTRFDDCRENIIPFDKFASNHNVILANVNEQYKIMLGLLKIPFEYYFQYLPIANEKQNKTVSSVLSSSQKSCTKNGTFL